MCVPGIEVTQVCVPGENSHIIHPLTLEESHETLSCVLTETLSIIHGSVLLSFGL